jgi:hypothetical protein
MTIMLSFIIGIALAAFIAFVSNIAAFDKDKSFYPTVLIVIASYYVLFAVISGQALIIESLFALIFVALAIVGMHFVPMLIGIALILHALFDLVHPHFIVNPGVPIWWRSFCGGFDLVIGVWVIYQTHKRKTQRQSIS